MKPLILFIHINKCGGTTLQNLFHQNFTKYISLYTTKKYRGAIQQNELKNLNEKFSFDGFGGHNLDPYLNYSLNRKIVYVVFFREPISRYMSQLNFRITRNTTKDLDHFLSNDHFDNYQIKRFSKNLSVKESIDFLKQENVFIGLLEDFDNSIIGLKNFMSKYNLAFNTKYTVANKTKSNPLKYNFKELPESVRSIIKEKNKYDLELYVEVKNIYKAKEVELKNFSHQAPKTYAIKTSFNNLIKKPKQRIVKWLFK